MLRNFIKNSMYLPSLLNSPRSPKNKIKAYIAKYRRIDHKASLFIENAKMLYDFGLIEK